MIPFILATDQWLQLIEWVLELVEPCILSNPDISSIGNDLSS